MSKNIISNIVTGVMWVWNGTKKHGLFLATLVATEYATFNYVQAGLKSFGPTEIATAVAASCVGAHLVAIAFASSGVNKNEMALPVLSICVTTCLLTFAGFIYQYGKVSTVDPDTFVLAGVVSVTLLIVRVFQLVLADRA